MESKRKIVGGSKALHFLLPDLIIPIDSKYAMTAFYGYNRYAKTLQKVFKIFQKIFEKSREITLRLRLSTHDVDGKKWNTSVPKLINNAIISLLNSDPEEVKELFNKIP